MFCLQAPGRRSRAAGGRWGSGSDPTGLFLWPTLTWACLKSTPPQVRLGALRAKRASAQTADPAYSCTGESRRLVAGGQVVGGRRLSFINDLTVTQDGKKVYFTDSSSRWQRRDYLQLIMEATADGRYGLSLPLPALVVAAAVLRKDLKVVLQRAGAGHGQPRSDRRHGEPALSQRYPAAAARGVGAGGRDHNGPHPQVHTHTLTHRHTHTLLNMGRLLGEGHHSNNVLKLHWYIILQTYYIILIAYCSSY